LLEKRIGTDVLLPKCDFNIAIGAVEALMPMVVAGPLGWSCRGSEISWIDIIAVTNAT